MYLDKNITEKNTIIKKINIKESFQPNLDKIDILNMRYLAWRNIYATNKKISNSLII